MISTIRDKHPILYKTARGVLVAVFWLALWEGLCLFLNNELLIVSPLAVARRLGELAGTTEFWNTIGVSFLRIFGGYLLGAAAGVLLGAAGAWCSPVHRLLAPILAIIKAAPVTSFVILALVWLKSYNLSIFISFLVVFPMIYTSVRSGIQNADRNLLEVARVYKFSQWKTLRLCYLPAVAPFLSASMSNAIGFGWKAGIAGEVFALPQVGIGAMLHDAKVYLEILDVFCWTAVIILLSLLVEKLLLWALHRKGKGGAPWRF